MLKLSAQLAEGNDKLFFSERLSGSEGFTAVSVEVREVRRWKLILHAVWADCLCEADLGEYGKRSQLHTSSSTIDELDIFVLCLHACHPAWMSMLVALEKGGGWVVCKMQRNYQT